jgi:hypothetical protein
MPTLTLRGKNLEPSIRRTAILALLYLIPIFQAMVPIGDLDIWWRLRTGQWVVENRAIPFTDVFSAQGVEKPWIEYSWLFEVLVYAVHAQFGLSGLVYFIVAMALMIAFAAHQLARRAASPILAETALVASALVAMKPLMTPRPWLFTILFFTIELWIIARARQSENERLLWVLPLMFALWANLHIQFVYGLAVLGLFLTEAAMKTCCGWFGYKLAGPSVSVGRLALVALGCFAATMLTPYHYLLYKQVFEYIGQTGAFQNITELHAMYFRSPDNWLVLLLTMSATFALGWQRKWLPFPTLLLLMGAFLAFRARRDVWVAILVAIYIISDFLRSLSYGGFVKFSKSQITIGALSVALALYLVSLSRQITEERLQTAVERKFPVNAVRYIKERQLSGPLFNDYDWGGFLLWSLPELPVLTDGRLNLYEIERLERLSNTWQGLPGWDSDPELMKAGSILAGKHRPLAALLGSHPRYKVLYEDDTAVIFVPVQKN